MTRFFLLGLELPGALLGLQLVVGCGESVEPGLASEANAPPATAQFVGRDICVQPPYQELGCRPQHLYLCCGRPASQILLESGACPLRRQRPDCWCRGCFETGQDALFHGALAVLRAQHKPNRNLTGTGDLACHTPLGMTCPKPFIGKYLGLRGTPCPMTKLTPNFS